MARFTRAGNSLKTTSRDKPRRSKGVRTPAPYPTPPPSTILHEEEPKSGLRRWMPVRTADSLAPIHEPEPVPTPMDTWASLSGRDRGIAGAALAVVALVGIGIGVAIPAGSTGGSAPQPVAGQTAPAAETDAGGRQPAPPAPPLGEPAPADDAAAVPAPEPGLDPAAASGPVDALAPGAAPVAGHEPAPQPAPPPEFVPAPAPAVVAEPAPAPQAAAEPVVPAAAYYANCTAVRAAGAAPIFAGDPGYGTHLDRDQDGIGCDT